MDFTSYTMPLRPSYVNITILYHILTKKLSFFRSKFHIIHMCFYQTFLLCDNQLLCLTINIDNIVENWSIKVLIKNNHQKGNFLHIIYKIKFLSHCNSTLSKNKVEKTIILLLNCYHNNFPRWLESEEWLHWQQTR